MLVTDYRLYDLAMVSGVSTRNIRAYRERGLLDPPRRVGRSAVYVDRHVAQLAAITRLLGRGFTIAHIAEFLTAIREGVDLSDMLGLHESVFGRPESAIEGPGSG